MTSSGTGGGLDDLLGVVLCGGGSRRFGSPKALATFDGDPLWRRAASALAGAGRGVVAVANDPGIARAITLETRPDVRPGNGPLGGLETALAWARDRAARGAFVLACDLPLVTSDLVRVIADAWPGRGAAMIRSASPWGLEPLCAAYGVDCLEAVSAALDQERLAVGELFPEWEIEVVPRSRAPGGDPDGLLEGVNRPEDLTRLLERQT